MKHQRNISAQISKYIFRFHFIDKKIKSIKLPPNSTRRCLGVNFNESRRRRNDSSLKNSGIFYSNKINEEKNE